METTGPAKKATLTKQGVRDLNHYGPRRPKEALPARDDDKGKTPPSVEPGERAVAK